MLRTVIVMDYQNVHLTAHDIFNRQSSKHYAPYTPCSSPRQRYDRGTNSSAKAILMQS